MNHNEWGEEEIVQISGLTSPWWNAEENALSWRFGDSVYIDVEVDLTVIDGNNQQFTVSNFSDLSISICYELLDMRDNVVLSKRDVDTEDNVLPIEITREESSKIPIGTYYLHLWIEKEDTKTTLLGHTKVLVTI